jgi:hypothetical protein
MSRSTEIQKWHRQYKMEAGVDEVDSREFAAWMEGKGWPMPKPVTPQDLLVRQIAQALREETRHDQETGEPYRANHYYVVTRNGESQQLWFDIDEAPRERMLTALTMRRQQMVGDATQLIRDAEHWNRRNPSEAAIQIELDFALDVEIERSASSLP